MKYDLLDAARQLVRLAGQAKDKDLNDAYQVLANNANDSKYTDTHEPLAGVAMALQAEINRRNLHLRLEAEDD